MTAPRSRTLSGEVLAAADDAREALSRHVHAVHVIATDGPAGRAGLTASAVTSVTLEPPTILICINREAGAHDAIAANGRFSVNTLARGQRAISDVFAGRGGIAREARFTHGTWHEGASGVPVLEGARAVLECRILEAREVATHTVFTAQVVAAASGTGDALCYTDRGYWVLAEDDEA